MADIDGTILIVDDEKHNRVLLEIALESKGYKSHMVSSGIAALEYLQDHEVELVLLDIMMPEMDGHEVVEYLRQSHDHIELPIIMVTAKTSSSDITRALQLGANDYVTKPVDLAVLQARIRTQLALKETRRALERSVERFDLAVRGTMDGIWDWNLVDNEVYYSDRWKKILGFRPSEIKTTPEEWFVRVRQEDKKRLQDDLKAHLNGETQFLECEYRLRHKDGSYRWVLTRGTALFGPNGKPYRIAGAQTDITHNKDFDPLTGLFSRSLFEERLNKALSHCREHNIMTGTVFLLGLDQFEYIRNSLGHLLEDELLVHIGKRLKNCIGSADCLARFGGDNFAMLFPKLQNPLETQSRVRRIRHELAKPFSFKDMEVFIHTGIGIVMLGGELPDPKTVLRNAFVALDESKRLGKDKSRVYDKQLHEYSLGLLRTESELRKGIKNGEFVLYYQPIVSLTKSAVVSVEALVRWHHPTQGFVMPGLFIEQAEQTGLIIDLGDWVLEEACRQTVQWVEAGIMLETAVNFSAHQFHRRNLVRSIMDILHSTGLPPRHLKIELTESSLMDDIDRTIAVLTELRQEGISISLDDFGTGYSSLSYLKKFPLDILKVDQSFVREITTDRTDAAITSAIIQMAHSLDLETISEGVETSDCLSFLKSMGCDLFQGYYLSKPLPPTELTPKLKTNELVPMVS